MKLEKDTITQCVKLEKDTITCKNAWMFWFIALKWIKILCKKEKEKKEVPCTIFHCHEIVFTWYDFYHTA